MVCPNCQVQVASGIAFCPECGTRMPVPAPTTRVLQDRYELVKKLGEGGMGAVYLAGDRRLSTVRWAVKEMSDAAITSPLERQQAGEAFKHEAELLARLSHPNLPRVTDHFQQDGKNYLVMEFVPGEMLLSYIQRLGLPRPLAEVQALAQQLCDVLSYLHSQSPPVIFRDLKPANIMLTPDGGLKLIDFGIARLFKPGQSRDTQAFGTVGYSAPEQYGRGQTDARSDIYSLGVLLHQLLSGYDPTASPFRLPPLIQLNSMVPVSISAALARATDNEPTQRYSDISEFRQAFLESGNFVQRGAAPIASPVPTIGAMGSALGSAVKPPRTTRLAGAAFWVGVASVAIMAMSTLMLLIAVFNGGTKNPLGGFGLILSVPALGGALIGATLGLIALLRPDTATRPLGKRHSTVGIATGVVALLLCCVMTYLISIASGSSEGLRMLQLVGV